MKNAIASMIQDLIFDRLGRHYTVDSKTVVDLELKEKVVDDEKISGSLLAFREQLFSTRGNSAFDILVTHPLLESLKVILARLFLGMCCHLRPEMYCFV